MKKGDRVKLTPAGISHFRGWHNHTADVRGEVVRRGSTQENLPALTVRLDGQKTGTSYAAHFWEPEGATQ